jgi:hypothetical protein
MEFFSAAECRNRLEQSISLLMTVQQQQSPAASDN